jgi:hypothetical protein
MHNCHLGFLDEQLTRLTELDLFGDDLLGLVRLCVKDAHANALVCIVRKDLERATWKTCAGLEKFSQPGVTNIEGLKQGGIECLSVAEKHITYTTPTHKRKDQRRQPLLQFIQL